MYDYVWTGESTASSTFWNVIPTITPITHTIGNGPWNTSNHITYHCVPTNSTTAYSSISGFVGEPGFDTTATIRNWFSNRNPLATPFSVAIQAPAPPSARDQLRDIIARRSTVPVTSSRRSVLVDVDDREQRARDTFRRVVGDDTFRRFLRDGFVSVRARSGRVYLVYPGYCKTRVFEKGRELQSLCVVLPGAFPPTDSLITRYLMLLNDEAGFISLAVKHGVPYRYPARPAVVDDDTLPAIARALRRVG